MMAGSTTATFTTYFNGSIFSEVFFCLFGLVCFLFEFFVCLFVFLVGCLIGFGFSVFFEFFVIVVVLVFWVLVGFLRMLFFWLKSANNSLVKEKILSRIIKETKIISSDLQKSTGAQAITLQG